MSEYSSAASRLGQKNFAGDERELMLVEFGQLVLEAWEETQDFKDFVFTKRIAGAKSDSFPIIGRKRDATEHTPGEIILGGKVEHDEAVIAVDQMMVDSVFIPDIDELLLHYSVRQAYARQLGESLGSVRSKRIAQTMVLASREAALMTGHPTPLRVGSATMHTDPAKMETAIYRAVQHIRENDIGGGEMKPFFPWQQQLLLARYTGIDKTDTSGSGDRAQGTVGNIAGLQPKGTNWVPTTDLSAAAGPSKYQGDFSKTVGFVVNAMCAGLLEARALRVWIKEQGDRLGTIMIASELYGAGILRPECSVEFTKLTTGTNVESLD